MKKTNLLLLLILSSLSLFGQERPQNKPKTPFVLTRDGKTEIATAFPDRAYDVKVYYEPAVTPVSVAKADWTYSVAPFALRFSEIGVKKQGSLTTQHFLYNLTTNTWVIFCVETKDGLATIYRYNPYYVHSGTTYPAN